MGRLDGFLDLDLDLDFAFDGEQDEDEEPSRALRFPSDTLQTFPVLFTPLFRVILVTSGSEGRIGCGSSRTFPSCKPVRISPRRWSRSVDLFDKVTGM